MTKLLLSFLSLSMLIIIVGLIYFNELKNLIEPLSPQSIPQDVENLERSFENSELINRILYRQLLTKYYLENYVYTNNTDALQSYYLYSELLAQLTQYTQSFKLPLWIKLDKQIEINDNYQQQILKYMQLKNISAAKKLLLDSQYIESQNIIANTLKDLYLQSGIYANEQTVISAKLAAKNVTKILNDSLETTLVIFIDAVVISIILSILSARAISRPINLLRNDIEQMTTKNLDIPLSQDLLKIRSEVGDLARSFAILLNKLRATTVFRDELLVEIERRIASEEKLRMTALNLEESNRDLDQFAYAASHDLRAPLRAIESLCEWIKDDCYNILPDASKKHFDLVIKRVKRLDALITGILEYARAGNILINFEKINVNKLVAEIIENLSPPSSFKITIDNVLPTFTTNKIALTQVFLNLISNAIKYNDKSYGRVHIGCETLEGFYQFSIADNGPGIDPLFFQKIFEIFQTLQPRDTIESAGIGLATVKKIIDRVGGKIWLTANKGQGTTFYFTWPR